VFKNLIIRIGQVLNTKTIPYMIIGGQAVILYGEPRLTRDIDIALGAGIESLPEFLDILKNLVLKPLPENLEQFVKQTMVLPAIDDNEPVEKPPEKKRLRDAKESDLAECVTIDFL
jgi:hypothetical protein